MSAAGRKLVGAHPPGPVSERARLQRPSEGSPGGLPRSRQHRAPAHVAAGAPRSSPARAPAVLQGRRLSYLVRPARAPSCACGHHRQTLRRLELSRPGAPVVCPRALRGWRRRAAGAPVTPSKGFSLEASSGDCCAMPHDAALGSPCRARALRRASREGAPSCWAPRQLLAPSSSDAPRVSGTSSPSERIKRNALPPLTGPGRTL